MKKLGFSFLTVIFIVLGTPQLLFAQVAVPTKTPQSNITPTPTPQTTKVTPTTRVAPSVTINPTASPKPITPTPSPIQTSVTPTKTPVANAVISEPPTPTPSPKPSLLTNIIQPTRQSPIHSVANNITRYLTVPFALSLHYLPKNVYTENGLSKQANAVLLFIAFMCMGAGTSLLIKPSVMRLIENKDFSFGKKEREAQEFTIPRIAFRN